MNSEYNRDKLIASQFTRYFIIVRNKPCKHEAITGSLTETGMNIEG